MTKKHFIALAAAIKAHNTVCAKGRWFQEHCPASEFDSIQLSTLADFCASQNPSFNRQRWLDYIDGKCTANGKKLK